MALSRVGGRNTRSVATTATKMATPPSIAVGFLCHRSLLGLAITPRRRAAARTTGVRASDTKNAAPPASNVDLRIDCMTRSDGARRYALRRAPMNQYIRRGPAHRAVHNHLAENRVEGCSGSESREP